MKKTFQHIAFLLTGALLTPAQVVLGPMDADTRRTLVATSSAVVVAVADPTDTWIVDLPKMRAATDIMPNSYVVGRLVRARVISIIKPDGVVKKNEELKLFLPGIHEPMDSGITVGPGEKSIFFVSPIPSSSDPRFKEVGLMSPKAPNNNVLPFDKTNLYRLTGEGYSVVPFSPKLVAKLKKDLHSQGSGNAPD